MAGRSHPLPRRPPASCCARRCSAPPATQLEQRAWSEITMADIAAAAGVSRQTLYKEFGSRDEFAQAFVIHEGERFLDDVEAAVRAAPRRSPRRRRSGAGALPAHRRRGPADPRPAQRRRHRRHAALRHDPGDAGRPIWATARLTAAIEEGWPQAPSADVAAARRIPGPAGDQLRHRAQRAPDATAAPVVDLLGPFIDRALGAA